MPSLKSEVSVNIIHRELQIEFAHAFKKALVDTIDLGKDTLDFSIRHPTRFHMGRKDLLSEKDWEDCLYKLTTKICYYYGYKANFIKTDFFYPNKQIKLTKI